MIEYLIIFSIVITQFAMYHWVDKKSFKINKIWILIGLITAQLFVFPQLTSLAYGLKDIKCGMPIVGLHLFFIIFGGGLNLIVHILYCAINRKKTKTTL